MYFWAVCLAFSNVKLTNQAKFTTLDLKHLEQTGAKKPTGALKRNPSTSKLSEKQGGNRIRPDQTWSGDLWRHQSP